MLSAAYDLQSDVTLLPWAKCEINMRVISDLMRLLPLGPNLILVVSMNFFNPLPFEVWLIQFCKATEIMYHGNLLT